MILRVNNNWLILLFLLAGNEARIFLLSYKSSPGIINGEKLTRIICLPYQTGLRLLG